MDIEKVLTSFERLATIQDVDIQRKLIALLDQYPFPALSRAQSWRKQQIRSSSEQHIAILTATRSREPG